MNDEKRLDALLDVLIEEVAKESAESIGQSYPEPEHQHVFSKRHEANMRKIFRKERNKLLFKKVTKYLQRAALFILVLTIISGATIFSVQACRVKFLNFITEITQIDTNINFMDKNSKGDSYSNDYITLDYIPDGFKLESSTGDNRQLVLVFKKADKGFRITINEVDSSLSIDTEKADIRKFMINGNEAMYSTNNNINILVWHDENFVYRLSGNLEEKELIKIAEKIKK